MHEENIGGANFFPDAELAIHLRRKELERRSDLTWSFLKTSLATLTATSLWTQVMSLANTGSHFPDRGTETLALSASVGALYVSIKLFGECFRRTPCDIPESFVAELRAKAADVAAHRNGKGLWIVRDPKESAPRLMTEGEFAKYEKLLAAQGRGLEARRACVPPPPVSPTGSGRADR